MIKQVKLPAQKTSSTTQTSIPPTVAATLATITKEKSESTKDVAVYVVVPIAGIIIVAMFTLAVYKVFRIKKKEKEVHGTQTQVPEGINTEELPGTNLGKTDSTLLNIETETKLGSPRITSV